MTSAEARELTEGLEEKVYPPNECGCKCKCNAPVTGCNGRKEMVVNRAPDNDHKTTGRITICGDCFIPAIDTVISDPKGIAKRREQYKTPPLANFPAESA